jgi:hypothetical protein
MGKKFGGALAIDAKQLLTSKPLQKVAQTRIGQISKNQNFKSWKTLSNQFF